MVLSTVATKLELVMFKPITITFFAIFAYSFAFCKDIPTRFGPLKINEQYILLYKNRPLSPTIRGNSSLNIVNTYQVGNSDVVLIQDNGGTACPASFIFLSVTRNGVNATERFGTCSYLIESKQVKESIFVKMPGFMGPYQPLEERMEAAEETHVFVFKAGALTELEVTKTETGTVSEALSPVLVPKPVGPVTQYFTQVGAFRELEDAKSHRAKLLRFGIKTEISGREISGRTVYRVRVGPFEKLEEGERAKDKLDKAGIETVLIRVQN